MVGAPCAQGSKHAALLDSSPVRLNVLRVAGAAYLALLAASCVVRHVGRTTPAPAPDETFVELPAVNGDATLDRTIRVAYEHAEPSGDSRAPTVVLLHGSPGGKHDFQHVLPELARRYRVIVPDLPGFGASEHDVPDYSFRAHARY